MENDSMDQNYKKGFNSSKNYKNVMNDEDLKFPEIRAGKSI